MELKILAETPQEKGKSFERLMGTVLDKLGFGNFRFDVHATGLELDIKADHKFTKNPIICECKAHERSIDSNTLNTFYGKFNVEKGKSLATQGYFFSTSGFIGTAVEWYDQNIPSYDKPNFKIFNNEDIIDLLTQSGLLIPENELEEKILMQVNHPLVNRYVVFFESRIYVVQIFQISDTAKRYVIYTGEGNLAGRTIYQQISSLDATLTDIPLVDLEIFDKVLLNLLDLKEKSTEKISQEITEDPNDVKAILEDLESESLLNVVENENVVYSIKNDVVTLTNLTKRFAKSKHKLTFMNTNFINLVLDDNFVNHISERFKIIFSDDQKTLLKEASRIFPTVLHTLFLSDTKSFENHFEQAKTMNLNESAKKLSDKNILSSFMHLLLVDIQNDLKLLHGNYLDAKNVLGYFTHIKFKIASEFELIFALDAGGTSALLPLKGSIDVGQMLSATNYSIFLKTGNLYMTLENYDDARKTFDKVIQNSDNKEWIMAAWSNKGLCYLREKKFPDAEECFDKTLEINDKIIPTLANKALCRRELGDSTGADELVKKIEEIKQAPDS